MATSESLGRPGSITAMGRRNSGNPFKALARKVTFAARAIRHPILAATVIDFARNHPKTISRDQAAQLFAVASRIKLPMGGIPYNGKTGTFGPDEIGGEYRPDYHVYSNLRLAMARTLVNNPLAADILKANKPIVVAKVDLDRQEYKWDLEAYKHGVEKDIKVRYGWGKYELIEYKRFRIGDQWFNIPADARTAKYSTYERDRIYQWREIEGTIERVRNNTLKVRNWDSDKIDAEGPI